MLDCFRRFPIFPVLAALVGGLGPACDDAESDSGSVRDGDADAGVDNEGAQDPRFGTVNDAFRDEMRSTPAEDGTPFYMVNLIKYREYAEYADGRETALTGREADALYARYATAEFLQSIGARPVFVADVEQQLLGDDVRWDQVAIVLYPSRAKFLEMVENPEFQARSVHKDAGVERSIVMVTVAETLPAAATAAPTDVPFPATDDDSAFDMIHLMNFHDIAQYEAGVDEPERSGEEAVDLYSNNAGKVAFPLGVRPTSWLQVQGVLIGDGREWDEFRINHFPSHAAFDELISNPDWADGKYHRDAGLDDTYSMQTLPIVNTL